MFGQKSRVEEGIISRGARLALQLIGVIVFGLIIISGVLVWRLTAGPVSLTFLTPYLEKALSTQNGSYRTVLRDTILKKVGGDRAFDLQLRGAQRSRPWTAAVPWPQRCWRQRSTGLRYFVRSDSPGCSDERWWGSPGVPRRARSSRVNSMEVERG